MGKLLAYSGTTTKIRAIQSRLLTPKDYTALSGMDSVANALAYLKQKPAYQAIFAGRDEKSLHRNEVEQLLTYSIYADFQKIYRFSTIHQREFMDLYFGRYEIALIKRSLRMVFDHRNIPTDLTIFTDFFNHHSSLNLNHLVQSRNVEEFVENLNGSIYYSPLKQLESYSLPTLWDYEMALDLFYFKWLWKKGQKLFKSKSDQKIFMDAYGTKIDLLNIQWIYRSKHYFQMDSPQIYAHLIPAAYHLTSQDIKSLSEAQGLNEMKAAYTHTYYGRRFPESDLEHLNKDYSRIRHKIQTQNARKDPYSIATLISYLYEKEHEIDKITTILEGVRYGLPKEKIETYVKDEERRWVRD